VYADFGSGVALGPDEIEMLRVSPVLHQEFHALAFCSETIRQIDFGNCTRSLSSRPAQQRGQASSLQFLTPILGLLRSGITKCNRLIVSGNLLPPADVDDLGKPPRRYSPFVTAAAKANLWQPRR
jgi:hypothetical protein